MSIYGLALVSRLENIFLQRRALSARFEIYLIKACDEVQNDTNDRKRMIACFPPRLALAGNQYDLKSRLGILKPTTAWYLLRPFVAPA